jgi:uncharacterized protein YjiS (DUF1127 family)
MSKTQLPQRMVEGFVRWRKKRMTYRALDQLNHRDLKDIGVARVGRDYISLSPHFEQ